MSMDIVNSLVGWGVGSTASYARGREMEIRQGKNYYLAALGQWQQVGSLGDVCLELNELAFEKPSSRIAAVIMAVRMIIYPIVGGAAAAIKHGDYERGVKNLNDLSRTYGIPVFLPEKLSEETKAVFSFLAEHMGEIFEIATAVSAVALIALGNPYYGGACLAALSYGILDRNNYIPRKISLFMETYMPTVSLFIVAAEGSFFSRAFALVSLPFYVVPDVSKYFQVKIDSLLKRSLGVKGYSLEEMEKPWVENKSLSFDEMKKILHGEDWRYELNVAHCTKQVCDLGKMLVSEKFDSFIALFDSVSWKDAKYYPLIRAKLLDDERFLCYLDDQFPNEAIIAKDAAGKMIPLSKEKADEYFTKLAGKQGLASKEEAAAFWQRNQMVELVDVLMGRARVKGSQQDLADGLSNLQKVLPHLLFLKETGSFVDLEDALLKLSVEGGGYCAAGIKRAAGELVKEAIRTYVEDANAGLDDPVLHYEFTLKRNLQDLRGQIVQKGYQKYIADNISDQLSADVHVFDLYRQYFAFGFYPMTDYERRNFGAAEFFNWEKHLRPLHEESVNEYLRSLDTAITGSLEFYAHMRSVLGSKLTEGQCEEIFSPLMDVKWSALEARHRYARLLWVMLGVMQEKK